MSDRDVGNRSTQKALAETFGDEVTIRNGEAFITDKVDVKIAKDLITAFPASDVHALYDASGEQVPLVNVPTKGLEPN